MQTTETSQAILENLELSKPICEKLIDQFNKMKGTQAVKLATLASSMNAMTDEWSKYNFLMCAVHYGFSIQDAYAIAEVLKITDGFIASMQMREEAMHHFRESL